MAQCLLYKYLGDASDSSFPPEDVTNLKVKEGNGQLVINWNDPQDSILEGQDLAKWKGTKLVLKESGFPLDPDDGKLIVDSTSRNQFSVNGVTIPDLINKKQYFLSLFPYSAKAMVNIGIENMTTGTPQALDPLPKDNFADYTWAEIHKISQQGIANPEIWKLYNIKVGDYKPVTINGSVDPSHGKEIHGTFNCVIVGLNHNSGQESGGITFTVGYDPGTSQLQSEIILEMDASSNFAGGWSGCDMRNKYCLNFYNILPSDLRSVVRTTTKYTSNRGSLQTTQDKVFIPSEFEVTGGCEYSHTQESSYQKQYQFFIDKGAGSYIRYLWSNRHHKYRPGDWWLRSSDSKAFKFVYYKSNGGTYSNVGSTDRSFAPFFVV